MSVPFVTVHLGAGKHSASQEKGLRKLCKNCCRDGMDLLEKGKTSQEVCIHVCKMLENSPLTNAGYGSQLNFDGIVECDASIMESSLGLGASVGAVTGIANPIELAGCLLQDLQDNKKDILGRVRPAMLVGRGAEKYAHIKGIEGGVDLISKPALSYFITWLELYNKYMASATPKDPPTEPDIVQDTVGVICGDIKGVISVATSSGGTTMKTPGRVGPAGLLGTGLNISRKEDSIRAICLSGTGEDIILSQAGSNFCDVLFSDIDIHQYFHTMNQSHNFQRPPFYFGALGICTMNDGSIDLVYLHTTEAFVVGYQFAEHPAVVEVSRNSTVGQLVLGGVTHKEK